jgi:hypothetical protein
MHHKYHASLDTLALHVSIGKDRSETHPRVADKAWICDKKFCRFEIQPQSEQNLEPYFILTKLSWQLSSEVNPCLAPTPNLFPAFYYDTRFLAVFRL